SGPQVMKEIGSDHGAKVVLISAYSGEYNLETAKSIGADMFVPKPFDDIFVIFETAESLCR
ncbi:MAG: response regulator, partial [Bdellovibrionales bacterium]|nr:response regulator [Bdellovibrionales bacterium]